MESGWVGSNGEEEVAFLRADFVPSFFRFGAGFGGEAEDVEVAFLGLWKNRIVGISWGMDERRVDTPNLGSQPGDVQIRIFQENSINQIKTISCMISLRQYVRKRKKGTWRSKSTTKSLQPITKSIC